MKFFVTFLSAAALLAPSIFAAPLGERGTIEARVPKKDYNVDAAIAVWMGDSKTQKRLESVCDTVGGWEGWAQVELEDEFRNYFLIEGDIREQSKVFKGKQIADFVLPPTDKLKGMIIELKCENKNTQKGKAMNKPVKDDIGKRFNVKPKYKDHTFVALAMAYSPEAQQVLTNIGMRPIAKASHPLAGRGVMKVYKEKFQLSGFSNGMKDLTEAIDNLNVSDSGWESDSGSESGEAKKPTGSGSRPAKKPTGTAPKAKKPQGSGPKSVKKPTESAPAPKPKKPTGPGSKSTKKPTVSG